MLKLSVIVLFLFAFIVPVLSVIFIIDQKRSGLKMFIYGVITYVVAETCVKLPLLNLFGFGESESIFYILVLTVLAAFFIELVRYFVLKFHIKRGRRTLTELVTYSAGFIAAYIFIVWGVDSVAMGAVVLLDDFGLMEPEEIWNEIITIITAVPIQFGLMLFCANAIRFKNRLYILLAVLIRTLTDIDMVFGVCGNLGLGSGVGILYLAVLCVIILMFVRKQIVYQKGNENEGFEE